MEGHIAHALANHIDPSEIVVIYTDDSTEAPGRTGTPTGSARSTSRDIVARMPKDRAQHALVMLLRSFHADAIVNINSRMLYHAMRTYGRRWPPPNGCSCASSATSRPPLGTWEGWSLRYFYRTFDYVTGVITDSDHLARELTSTYQRGGAPARALARLPGAGRLPAPGGRRVARQPRAQTPGLLGGSLGPAEADPGVPRRR